MNVQNPPAQAAASNLNVRQLAATLTKTSPAPSEQAKPAKTVTGDTTAAAADPKATATGEPRESTANEATENSLTTVESDAEATQETQTEMDTDTGAETASAENTEAETSPDAETTTETTEAHEQAANELPPEVKEAIEIAKAQDGGKGKAEMLKRINKIVDQRDTERNARLQAEEQAAQLRAELQSAKAQPAQAAMPAGVHPEVHKVQQELANVDHWLGWCEEQLPRLQSGEVETVELDLGGKKIQVDAKQVAQTKRDLEHARQEAVARKVATENTVKTEFTKAYQQMHQTALTVYPWLKNPQSPEVQQMHQILQAFPAFKQSPDYELAIGDFLAGKAAREARAKAPVNPVRKAAPSREPTRVVTEAPNSGGEAQPGEQKQAKQSAQQFEKTGSTRDLARSLTASRRVSRITR